MYGDIPVIQGYLGMLGRDVFVGVADLDQMRFQSGGSFKRMWITPEDHTSIKGYRTAAPQAQNSQGRALDFFDLLMLIQRGAAHAALLCIGWIGVALRAGESHNNDFAEFTDGGEV